ncbi:actin maturation protease isoform X4 [Bacillus rossius redtenbacheri]|uniref:actin maturation protease isoform X4 n=1 Tax=Bacillus rossius redtenbacheri TaxID=93214 RepID=UPI002FDCD777
MVHGGATLPALRSCWACAQMSSERSPPAPPLPPLLAGEVPAALASVLSACTCGSPEQELLALRDRLWLREGTPQPPHVSFYRYIEPVLQDGPKCGLVALSMASSCTAHPLPVDRLLREARLRGFTNHGEMFSADDMASLARDLLRPCREVEVLRQGLDDREYVVRCVSRGGVLLVPYPSCTAAVAAGNILAATGQIALTVIALSVNTQFDTDLFRTAASRAHCSSCGGENSCCNLTGCVNRDCFECKHTG